jgi:carbonic anhydrase
MSRSHLIGRRTLLKTALSTGAFSTAGFGSPQFGGVAVSEGSLTKERRDSLTPDQVIEKMKKGNQQFLAGKVIPRDHLAQQKTSSLGQYPAAVILGCIDSRAPAEIVLNAGIGDTFNARIAGNVVNDDILGSMEYSCAVIGAKVVLVLGHTACGAIKGAIDNVEMGNLTGLLARVKPAITATTYSGDKSGKNAAYVDAVARTNVARTVDMIRRRSIILEDMEKQHKIKIVGAMYDLKTGIVDFLS